MKQLKVGVIGAGNRAASYFTGMPPEMREAVRIHAIADPSPARRDTFARVLAEGRPVQFYEDGQALLDRETLDALIIGTPNHAHADDAIAAMACGVPLLLEKPVAISVEQCRRLWQAYQNNGRPAVFVGFVLRYTPFYARLKSLLREGLLGQILSIDMDENIQSSVTSLYFRGWRRWDRLSGGFMVEKCCHDFDVLNHLADAKATRVFSMAERSHFVPRPRAEQQRRFDHETLKRTVLDYHSPIAETRLSELSAASIYDLESDVPDHQSVMVAFDNGILSCFSAAHAQPRSTRRTRICGAAGALEGDIERSRIRMDRHQGEVFEYVTSEIQVDAEAGGHYGGDAQLKQRFWDAAAGHTVDCQAGIREGIEAVLVALAAEQSRQTGQPVAVEPLRQQVFQAREREQEQIQA